MTDREKLIELIKEANLSMWGKSGISSAAERREYLADYLISKGVTIPVRCKECESYDDGYCIWWEVRIREDGFCSDGERREE